MMPIKETYKTIQDLVAKARHIVVVQADNPDGDSLASALALEHILGDLDKQITLYCGVDLPSYLLYMLGSDRVVKELPRSFDLSIIVDTSSDSLLEQLTKTGAKAWLAAKPCVIIDHHVTAPSVSFASTILNPTAVATTEVIYELAKKLSWPLSIKASNFIAIGILSDSLGLTSGSTSARSIHIIAELVEAGISLPDIENTRRETMRRDAILIPYKGQLLQRVEFLADGRIAMLAIPWEEIEKYSPLYNPPMLVLDDMRLAQGTALAICFKLYPGGKVTAKIRCNYGFGIGDKLAEHFGGGGHPYAAGFKIQDGRSYEEIKAEAIATATKLLDETKKDYAKTA